MGNSHVGVYKLPGKVNANADDDGCPPCNSTKQSTRKIDCTNNNNPCKNCNVNINGFSPDCEEILRRLNIGCNFPKTTKYDPNYNPDQSCTSTTSPFPINPEYGKPTIKENLLQKPAQSPGGIPPNQQNQNVPKIWDSPVPSYPIKKSRSDPTKSLSGTNEPEKNIVPDGSPAPIPPSPTQGKETSKIQGNSPEEKINIPTDQPKTAAEHLDPKQESTSPTTQPVPGLDPSVPNAVVKPLPQTKEVSNDTPLAKIPVEISGTNEPEENNSPSGIPVTIPLSPSQENETHKIPGNSPDEKTNIPSDQPGTVAEHPTNLPMQEVKPATEPLAAMNPNVSNVDVKPLPQTKEFSDHLPLVKAPVEVSGTNKLGEIISSSGIPEPIPLTPTQEKDTPKIPGSNPEEEINIPSNQPRTNAEHPKNLLKQEGESPPPIPSPLTQEKKSPKSPQSLVKKISSGETLVKAPVEVSKPMNELSQPKLTPDIRSVHPPTGNSKLNVAHQNSPTTDFDKRIPTSKPEHNRDPSSSEDLRPRTSNVEVEPRTTLSATQATPDVNPRVSKVIGKPSPQMTEVQVSNDKPVIKAPVGISSPLPNNLENGKPTIKENLSQKPAERSPGIPLGQPPPKQIQNVSKFGDSPVPSYPVKESGSEPDQRLFGTKKPEEITSQGGSPPPTQEKESPKTPQSLVKKIGGPPDASRPVSEHPTNLPKQKGTLPITEPMQGLNPSVPNAIVKPSPQTKVFSNDKPSVKAPVEVSGINVPEKSISPSGIPSSPTPGKEIRKIPGNSAEEKLSIPSDQPRTVAEHPTNLPKQRVPLPTTEPVPGLNSSVPKGIVKPLPRTNAVSNDNPLTKAPVEVSKPKNTPNRPKSTQGVHPHTGNARLSADPQNSPTTDFDKRIPTPPAPDTNSRVSKVIDKPLPQTTGVSNDKPLIKAPVEIPSLLPNILEKGKSTVKKNLPQNTTERSPGITHSQPPPKQIQNVSKTGDSSVPSYPIKQSRSEPTQRLFGTKKPEEIPSPDGSPPPLPPPPQKKATPKSLGRSLVEKIIIPPDLPRTVDEHPKPLPNQKGLNSSVPKGVVKPLPRKKEISSDKPLVKPPVAVSKLKNVPSRPKLAQFGRSVHPSSGNSKLNNVHQMSPNTDFDKRIPPSKPKHYMRGQSSSEDLRPRTSKVKPRSTLSATQAAPDVNPRDSKANDKPSSQAKQVGHIKPSIKPPVHVSKSSDIRTRTKSTPDLRSLAPPTGTSKLNVAQQKSPTDLDKRIPSSKPKHYSRGELTSRNSEPKTNKAHVKPRLTPSRTHLEDRYPSSTYLRKKGPASSQKHLQNRPKSTSDIGKQSSKHLGTDLSKEHSKPIMKPPKKESSSKGVSAPRSTSNHNYCSSFTCVTPYDMNYVPRTAVKVTPCTVDPWAEEISKKMKKPSQYVSLKSSTKKLKKERPHSSKDCRVKMSTESYSKEVPFQTANVSAMKCGGVVTDTTRYIPQKYLVDAFGGRFCSKLHKRGSETCFKEKTCKAERTKEKALVDPFGGRFCSSLHKRGSETCFKEKPCKAERKMEKALTCGLALIPCETNFTRLENNNILAPIRSILKRSDTAPCSSKRKMLRSISFIDEQVVARKEKVASCKKGKKTRRTQSECSSKKKFRRKAFKLEDNLDFDLPDLLNSYRNLELNDHSPYVPQFSIPGPTRCPRSTALLKTEFDRFLERYAALIKAVQEAELNKLSYIPPTSPIGRSAANTGNCNTSTGSRNTEPDNGPVQVTNASACPNNSNNSYGSNTCPNTPTYPCNNGVYQVFSLDQIGLPTLDLQSFTKSKPKKKTSDLTLTSEKLEKAGIMSIARPSYNLRTRFGLPQSPSSSSQEGSTGTIVIDDNDNNIAVIHQPSDIELAELGLSLISGSSTLLTESNENDSSLIENPCESVKYPHINPILETTLEYSLEDYEEAENPDQSEETKTLIIQDTRKFTIEEYNPDEDANESGADGTEDDDYFEDADESNFSAENNDTETETQSNRELASSLPNKLSSVLKKKSSIRIINESTESSEFLLDEGSHRTHRVRFASDTKPEDESSDSSTSQVTSNSSSETHSTTNFSMGQSTYYASLFRNGDHNITNNGSESVEDSQRQIFSSSSIPESTQGTACIVSNSSAASLDSLIEIRKKEEEKDKQLNKLLCHIEARQNSEKDS